MSAWLHHDFRNPHGCCMHLCTMLCVKVRGWGRSACASKRMRVRSVISAAYTKSLSEQPASFPLPVAPPPGVKGEPPERLEIQTRVWTTKCLSKNLWRVAWSFESLSLHHLAQLWGYFPIFYTFCESEWVKFAQLCLTLCDPMDHSLPGSFVHGILAWEVGSNSLLQGNFPAQGSNSGLLHCRQILCHLSHQRNPTHSVLILSSLRQGSRHIDVDIFQIP